MPTRGIFTPIREDDPLWRPDGEKHISANPLQDVVEPGTTFWEANESFNYYQRAGEFIPRGRLDKLIWNLHCTGCTDAEIATRLGNITGKQVWTAIQRIRKEWAVWIGPAE